MEENNKIKKAQKTNSKVRNQKINKKPTFNIELDPIVTEAAKEVQQEASHARRWPGGAHQVAGALGCGRTLPNGYWPPPSGNG